MKLASPLLTRLGGLLGSAVLRGWSATLDAKVAYYDPAVDPSRPSCRIPKIYVFWHEYLLSLLTFRGHCHAALLISRHLDAEILSRVALHLGYETVRGSTRRGGVAALRQVLADRRGLHLAITPDGPRGPRRHFAPGAVYLASRLRMPLVPIGLGYERPWRLGSWDKFAIPRPFSRSCVLFGPEIHVPADLDRLGLEHFRVRIEQLLNRLTTEVECWADSGTRRAGQTPFIPCPARHRLTPPRLLDKRRRRPTDIRRLAGPHLASTGRSVSEGVGTEAAAIMVKRAC